MISKKTKSKTILMLILTVCAILQSFSVFANESMNEVAQSKQVMEGVTNYIAQLREKRASQTVQEIMEEKYQVIEDNMQKLYETKELSAADIEELRIATIAQLNKFQGIDDASVITEMEIAEIQNTLTSENLLFIFTRMNVEWYQLILSNRCFVPITVLILQIK